MNFKGNQKCKPKWELGVFRLVAIGYAILPLLLGIWLECKVYPVCRFANVFYYYLFFPNIAFVLILLALSYWWFVRIFWVALFLFIVPWTALLLIIAAKG